MDILNKICNQHISCPLNEFLIKFQHVLHKYIFDCDVIASKMVKEGNDAS